MRNKFKTSANPKDMWLVIDRDGKVVEYYRNKVTLLTNFSRLKKIYGKDLEIKKNEKYD